MAIERRIKTPNVENANWISKNPKIALKMMATAWQYSNGRNNLSKISHGTSFEIGATILPRLNDSWRNDKRRLSYDGTWILNIELKEEKWIYWN